MVKVPYFFFFAGEASALLPPLTATLSPFELSRLPYLFSLFFRRNTNGPHRSLHRQRENLASLRRSLSPD